MENSLNIPKHWAYISLVEDFNYVPTGVEAYLGKRKYYSTGSIKETAYTPEGEYSFDDRPSRANRVADKEDVLQARMKGTNKVLLIDAKLEGSLFSTGFFQVRPYENTYVSKFLYYYLSSSVFLKEKDDLCSGSTQSALNDTNAKKLKVPLPPLGEQKRIVEKVEELFSELDSSIEGLQKAKVKLKQYRQAVLKSAFEGKLTEVWREKHGDELEDTEVLLKRIKKEREETYEKSLETWEEAVKLWEEKGKTGKKPIKPKKLKELIPLSKEELIELSNIPEVWKWVTLESLCSIITDGDHQAPPKAVEGIPFIVISNIKNNSIDFTNTKYVPLDYYNNLQEYRKVKKRDILYTVTGSYGIPVLINYDKKFVFQRHIGLIRLYKIVHEKYIYYFLKTQNVYNQATEVATGTAQKTVPLSGIRNFKIPLVPLKEQNKIVHKIESRFNQADEVEEIINLNLKKVEYLRQSILKNAFEGKLVSQNTDDEPVSKLLARIEEEKKTFIEEEKIRKKIKKKKMLPKKEKYRMEILEILQKQTGWMKVQNVFEAYTDKKDTDTVEIFYQKLRELLNQKEIEIQRKHGNDHLRIAK